MAIAVLCQLALFVSPLANANPDYVRLTAEIRGTLEVNKDRLIVIVNQGGGCMTVYNDFWTLDFGSNDALRASALKLHGKAVVLTGEPDRPLGLPHKAGVGVKATAPPRLLIRVKTLTAAPGK
ncbi:MAG: hypothetical protein FJ304_05810 [Planctomycetes bacterium]|nr:hypothetical protein [Planctomycetota bacterium]